MEIQTSLSGRFQGCDEGNMGKKLDTYFDLLKKKGSLK